MFYECPLHNGRLKVKISLSTHDYTSRASPLFPDRVAFVEAGPPVALRIEDGNHTSVVISSLL